MKKWERKSVTGEDPIYPITLTAPTWKIIEILEGNLNALNEMDFDSCDQDVRTNALVAAYDATVEALEFFEELHKQEQDMIAADQAIDNAIYEQRLGEGNVA